MNNINPKTIEQEIKPQPYQEENTSLAVDELWHFLDEEEFHQEMKDSLLKNPNFDLESKGPNILLLMHKVLYNIMDSFRDSHFGTRELHDDNRNRIKNGYKELAKKLTDDSFLYFISIGAGVVGLVGAGFVPSDKTVNPGKILETISGIGKTGGEFANAFSRGGQELLRGAQQEFQNDLKRAETTDGKILSDLQTLRKLTSDADERQYQSMRKAFGGG